MKKLILLGICVLCAHETVLGHVIPTPYPPLPPPEIFIADLSQNEEPVKVESSSRIIEENAMVRRTRMEFVFTNPNLRIMAADVEFPLPKDATVCGYALEVKGVMVPGVIVEKEKARVAFETERAKGVDPGIVEKVKGNFWKTRIFPLSPKVPRRAYVEYIEPVADGDDVVICERDGKDVFLGERTSGNAAGQDVPAGRGDEPCKTALIIWDASSSAEKSAAAWKKNLTWMIADEGEFDLVLLRNDVEFFGRFAKRADVISALDKAVYDGGTDLSLVVRLAGDLPTLLFTDELDTLGLETGASGIGLREYENKPNIMIASREATAEKFSGNRRKVTVRKLVAGERVPDGLEVKDGKLLATLWAANRVKDLSAQSAARKSEFLELGRRYGVASEVASLIVLENMQQYLDHKIEPPKGLPFYDEWVRRRAAQDDEIAAAKLAAEHERALLELWEQRIEWWNNPIPPENTPKSGLFDSVDDSPMLMEERHHSVAPSGERRRAASANTAESMPMQINREAVAMSEPAEEAGGASDEPSRDRSGGASITLRKWEPNAKYVDAIAKASDPYAEYLVQKKEFGASPAFYMDTAHLFFTQGKNRLAKRILSNMAEFQLEDAAIWRAMGWRLREAGELEESVRCMRHALRLRNEEGQARRDLALVLAEDAKKRIAADRVLAVAELEEAMLLLHEAAFTPFARRSARRSNDRQIAIIALEELNALIAWCEANKADAKTPEIKPVFRRDMPVKVRIALAWDSDETDIDIHVLEPEGEEAYYAHRRTGAGGFVGEDVTTGYGPEEYLRKDGSGTFKMLVHYYASHQADLTGAVTATATIWTDWGTAAEKSEIMTMRLDKPREKVFLGEVHIR